ncbi:MAG: class I SAM-dependent methyltransferase [Candidatus Dormibacteria bacterium]
MIQERAGRLFYRLTYEHGKPRWDTEVAPEPLVGLVGSLSPGRFLDLGCGTGTTAVRLAGMGWEVLGIDYVPAAVERARRRAEEAGVTAEFRLGDVTRLDGAVQERRYDLILDAGCYHGLSSAGRERYAAAVAGAATPGATFLLFGFRRVPPTWRLIGAPGSGTGDAATRFARWFSVEELPMPAGDRGRTAWYRMRRRDDAAPG